MLVKITSLHYVNTISMVDQYKNAWADIIISRATTVIMISLIHNHIPAN
jgi:hypothetical protein